MAFVRKKRVNGKKYYQLVESYREAGKMRQRVIVHLGKSATGEDAAQAVSTELAATRERQRKLLEERAEILKKLYRSLPNVMAYYGGEPPRRPELTSSGYKRIEYGRDDHASLGTYGYYHFVGSCGRYWKIPEEVEKLEAQALRLEDRLGKLETALSR